MANGNDGIGSAHMAPDRTIVLTLRAEAPGVIGDASFSYAPSDANYDMILAHLGGMQPGDSKIVQPFGS